MEPTVNVVSFHC